MHSISAGQQQKWGQPPYQHSGITTEGNTVVTRYAPPPGYQQQARPQPPWTWQTPTHSQAATGYQQGVYAPQPYSASQKQYSQAGYPNAQPSNAAYQHHDWPPQYDNSRSTTPASAPWQQSSQTSDYFRQRHNSAPHATAADHLLDGNGDLMPPMDSSADMTDSLEHDFDGECYYARHPEEVVPSLSLGLIEWKAPLPAKRALPSTFDGAELEAMAPRLDPLPGESVSEYFSLSNRDEALLDVRESKHWHEVKDSVIYRKLSAVCENIISIRELQAQYRKQYDAQWAEGPRSPTPALTREPTPAQTDSRPVSRASNYSQAMEVDDRPGFVPNGRLKSVTPSIEHGVLDDLEAALGTDSRFASHSRAPPVAHARGTSVSHSRAGSVTHQHRRSGSVPYHQSRSGSVTQHSRSGSVTGHHRRRSSTKVLHSKPLPAIHDQKQEDILAALGVTGSAQTVYQTPGPAFGSRPSTAGSDRASSRNNSVTSLHDAPGGTVPPTIREEDVEPDDDATPRPARFAPANNNMRKRSYADSVAGAHFHEDEDATPKRIKSGKFRM